MGKIIQREASLRAILLESYNKYTLCRKHHRNGKIQTLHARNLEQVCKLPDDLIEGSLEKEYNTYWMVYFAILWFIVFLIKQLANQKYLANIFSFNIF